MIRTRNIISILVIIILLAGCGESAAEKAETLNKEAYEYYVGDDITSALSVYKSSLDLVEDKDIRSKVSDIEYEIASAKKIISLIDQLRATEISFSNTASDNDFFEITGDVEHIVDEIQNFEVPAGTQLAWYYDQIKKTDILLLLTYVYTFKTSLHNGASTGETIEELNNLTTEIKKITAIPVPDIYKKLP